MWRGRAKIGSVDRIVAAILGMVWLVAGMAGAWMGVAQGSGLAVVIGLAAVFYASLWLRVAARQRLLTWPRLVFPWRAR